MIECMDNTFASVKWYQCY